jgi:hypothetical protein
MLTDQLRLNFDGECKEFKESLIVKDLFINSLYITQVISIIDYILHK